MTALRVPCLVFLSILAFGVACESGVEPSDDGDGDEERTGLTVAAPVLSGFSSIAQELGWGQSVPGVEVRVHRIGDPIENWSTGTTDSNGVVRFPDLLPGFYRIAAIRRIEGQETVATDGRVRALADGDQVHVTEGDSIEVELGLDEAGGLRIREVYIPNPSSAEENYSFGAYHVIYNNSESTIFLDGKIYGMGFDLARDFSADVNNCDATSAFRTDPDGVWARHWHRFPGSGSDFPLGPGEGVILALDAIDHTEFSSRAPDLSGADFEFFSTSDVDNPNVPNMDEAGLAPFPVFFGGHGLKAWAPVPLFIAEHVDPAGLPSMEFCNLSGCFEFGRIPASALLDVVHVWEPLFDTDAAPCNEPIHSRFDRLPGGFFKFGLEDLDRSVQRQVLRTEDGREILLSTNVTAVDFIKPTRTIP